MAKLFYVSLAIFLILALTEETSAVSGECPTPNQVYSCSPKCLQDFDCSGGRKCCPNNCNTKSCSETKTQGTSGKGGSSSGGAGSYCGNVKCSSYEKCDLDRTTKKMKCVRT